MSLAVQRHLAQRRAAGFGDGVTWGNIDLGFPDDGFPSDGGNDDDDGPPWWVTSAPLFGIIGKTVSNIFAPYQTSAAQAGVGVYRPPVVDYRTIPNGYRYDSSGNLVKESLGNVTDFISNNFLLVGAGVLGVILLFRQPPGRR